VDGSAVSYHCAGQAGSKVYFDNCTQFFRIKNCSGYVCDQSVPGGQCKVTDDGKGVPTKAECTGTGCESKYARCDAVAKKCTPCTQVTPDCTNTLAYCDASCGIPKAMCNTTTKQCVPCTKTPGPMGCVTKIACTNKCSTSDYGICDKKKRAMQAV
jgi:hypothetical protein